MRAAILIALLTSGCAFTDPVWEFTTGGNTGMDAGLDASQPSDSGTDGSSPADAGRDAGIEPGDAGPVGPDVCRPCTFATDEGCPEGHGCYVSTVAGATCTVCVERTGVDAVLGEACSSGPDCQQGFDCIASRCRTFCNGSAQCSADELCFKNRATDPTGWCLGIDCDAGNTASCPTGSACVLAPSVIDTRLATVCAPAGTGGHGESCATGCEAGTTCVGALCMRYCPAGGCPAGEGCVQLGILPGDAIVAACFPLCDMDTDCPAAEIAWTCNAANMVCVPGGG